MQSVPRWAKRCVLGLAAAFLVLAAWVMNHKMSMVPGGRFYAARQALTKSGREWASIKGYSCPCDTNDWTDTRSEQSFYFDIPQSDKPVPGALVTLSRAGPLLPWHATKYEEGKFEPVMINGMRGTQFKADSPLR